MKYLNIFDLNVCINLHTLVGSMQIFMWESNKTRKIVAMWFNFQKMFKIIVEMETGLLYTADHLIEVDKSVAFSIKGR